MYKLQMKFQRLIAFLCIAAAALTFIYSLGCMTDMYFLYQVRAIKPGFEIPGAEVFYDMQPFNRTFTGLSVVLIILAVAGLVFSNHSRRRYYVANYCTILISSIANIGVAIWSYTEVLKYKAKFLAVEFEVLGELVDSVPESVFKKNGIDPANLAGPYSTFWFDISIVAVLALVIVSVLNIINMLWKISLMAAEKRALAKGGR